MSVGEPAASVPYAGRTVIALDPGQFDVVQRTVAALFRVGHAEAYATLVDASAPDVARFAPGNHGVFMGYDFHLTAAGPRLIEVNTNAGGALLNGLHTATLCEPARLARLCDGLLSVDTMEQRILTRSAPASRAVRVKTHGSAPSPSSMIDRKSSSARGVLALPIAVRAPRALLRDRRHRRAFARRRGTAACLGDLALDLVYLRDTDFCSKRRAAPCCAQPLRGARSS